MPTSQTGKKGGRGSAAKERRGRSQQAAKRSKQTRQTKQKEGPDLPPLLADHRQFWDGLEDQEFFGADLEHLYFYDIVNEESVQKLRQEILEAARGKVVSVTISADGSKQDVRLTPRPIVIHVHSPGGYLLSGNWLYSLFNQVHVPICTVIDSEAASAATFLTVSSPYRVITEYGRMLLHDYSGGYSGKRENMLAEHHALERQFQGVKAMYLRCTDYERDELDQLMRRDVWLDAETCTKKGVCDRIIRPDRSAAAERKMDRIVRSTNLDPLTAPFMKTNWNVVYSSCDLRIVQQLDELLAHDETAKPVVFNTPGDLSCYVHSVAFACIPRIQSFSVPVFGIIDNIIDWWDMLPVLFCHRRYMYDNAQVDFSDLMYVSATMSRLEDIVQNAMLDRSQIVNILKRKARPSAELLDDIFERPVILSAAECLEMGFVDTIVSTHPYVNNMGHADKRPLPELPPASPMQPNARARLPRRPISARRADARTDERGG